MGIEINYRTSTSKKEILDSLIEIQVESSPLLIWQNDGGKRHISKAKIESINYISDSLLLRPFSCEDENIFNKLRGDATLYLRGNNKNIVFKQEKPVKKTTSSLLQILIPNEVKMFEKRSEMRKSFIGQNPKVTAEIYPGGRIDNTTKTITVDINDVSISGMFFLLTKKHARLFFEKDKIKIIRIGNYHFPRGIYGEIIHTGSAQNNIDCVRVGIRFNEKITSEIITDISIL